jgi:hypothetical protein
MRFFRILHSIFLFPLILSNEFVVYLHFLPLSENSNRSNNEYIIYAPSGRLGIVLDHPASSTAVGNQQNEGPVVCMIKESSPLMNSIEVGDHIVALDDIDVREMLPIKVSKLMNKRSQHPARKLTMMRNSGVCSIVSP